MLLLRHQSLRTTDFQGRGQQAAGPGLKPEASDPFGGILWVSFPIHLSWLLSAQGLGRISINTLRALYL